MTDIRLTFKVRYAEGMPARGLRVLATDQAADGLKPYDLGVTDGNGRIDKTLRLRKRQRVDSRLVDNLRGRPVFDITVSDRAGNSVTRRKTPIVLPAEFSPSAIAARLLTAWDANAPGQVLLIRRNNEDWVDATRGAASIGSIRALDRPMTRDTIMHLASMTKPVTATAVAAMIDDWKALHSAVHSPNGDLYRVRIGTRSVEVPACLAALFSDRQQAALFVDGPWPTTVPSEFVTALRLFVQGPLTVRSAPEAPPGYYGLLKRVLRDDPVPDFDSKFLPLIRERLGDSPIGGGVDQITITNLMRHFTGLVGKPTANLHTQAELQAIQDTQPLGGAATFPLWPWMRLVLGETVPAATRVYTNNNYIVLTAVIEACTETTYADYSIRRLFADPRFSTIRRNVADSLRSAKYYSGARLNFTGGWYLSDYTAFPGHGGLYVTAPQFLDWLHALYTKEPVTVPGGIAPLLSDSSHRELLEGARYAFVGTGPVFHPEEPKHRFEVAGGTNVNGAAVNGKFAIIPADSGALFTVFYCANGSLDAAGPFNALRDKLTWA